MLVDGHGVAVSGDGRQEGEERELDEHVVKRRLVGAIAENGLRGSELTLHLFGYKPRS